MNILNLKMTWLFFYLLIFHINTYAADKITVDLSTDKATLDEQVTMIIRVESDASVDPVLTADPVNAEILINEYQGATTSTVYMNGQLSTKREFVFAVVLKAKSLGRAGLNNIIAEIGGRNITHPAVWFSAVQEKAELPPVFLLAQPSKTQVYQNEGILVRYYLMSQVDIASFDIKEFPKLNNFVKRYLQEQGTRERVAYEGRQFIRQLLYSLVLFPEKNKLLKLDPMRVNITYDADNQRDPFGFGRGRLVTKTISSKVVDIEVLTIPAEKMPTGYTGLVGKHTFALTVNKNKVLVNEPVEIKLKITGTGNLEGVDAPAIIQDASVESFEANSNFEVIDAMNASKTFEYTYLPRKEIKIPSQKIPLSFFNSDSKQFETVEVDFPGLEVIGGAYASSAPANNSSVITSAKEESKGNFNRVKIIDSPKYSGPIFSTQASTNKYINLINVLLLVLSMMVVMKMGYDSKHLLPWAKPSQYRKKLKVIAENGVSYAAIEDLLLTFPKPDNNLALKNKLSQLDLPKKTKENLNSLVEQLNQKYASGTKENLNTLNNEKNMWKKYKNDMCLLIQALEAWDHNKTKDIHEHS